MARGSLHVEHFGPIARADIEFGDLTILVGPQATGKSLLLQLWKLAVDGDFVRQRLRDEGVAVETPADGMDVYLGEGMSAAWRGLDVSEARRDAKGSSTRVRYRLEGTARPRPLRPNHFVPQRVRSKRQREQLRYVPAHRSLLMGGLGWPQRFQQLPTLPVVARLFSDQLHLRLVGLGAHHSAPLFPRKGYMKAGLRRMLDEVVLRGAEVCMSAHGRQRQMVLRMPASDEPGRRTQLAYAAWTTGRRELVPLLLSLDELMPAGARRRREPFDWVVVEEPELGLHPLATLSSACCSSS